MFAYYSGFTICTSSRDLSFPVEVSRFCVLKLNIYLVGVALCAIWRSLDFSAGLESSLEGRFAFYFLLCERAHRCYQVFPMSSLKAPSMLTRPFLLTESQLKLSENRVGALTAFLKPKMDAALH